MPFEPRRPLARQQQATPYTAQFAANQGLAGAANQMHALNQQIAARGPVPYQPSPVSPGQPAPSPYSPAMQQMVNRGLNNARFGNARESMLYDISHPGNGYRPPVEPRGGSVTQVYPRPNATPFTPPDPAEFAKRQGLEFNPQTGVLAGNSQAAGMNARQLGNLRAGVNPLVPAASKSQLAANRQSYLAKREEAAKAAPVETPYQKRLAMRQAAQQTTAERMFAFQHPEAAAQMAAVKARTQIAADDRKSRETGLEKTLQSQERQIALKGGVDASTGLPVSAPKSPLEAPGSGKFAHLNPEELDIALKDYPQATRDRIKSELANKPNFFRDWLGGAAGEAIGSAIGRKLDPYGPVAPWLGINSPPLSRPTRGRRGVSGSR